MRFSAVLAVFLVPMFSFAATDIHFTADGKVIAKGVSVYQRSGNNLFVRALWGDTFLRMLVVPTATSTIVKAHGELTSVQEIKSNDILDIIGTLVPGGDAIAINATSIIDNALQQGNKTLSGTISALNADDFSFTLPNKIFGNTKIVTDPNTVITKGVRTITYAELTKGDKVTSVTGTYDYTTNTLHAGELVIYQDSSLFKPRNFDGTLKNITETALPTTATITVGNTEYTVYLSATSSVLSSSRKTAALSRLLPGDKVRFYGAVRPASLSEIDAEILRDLNF